MDTRELVVSSEDAVLLSALERHADRRREALDLAIGARRIATAALDSVVEYEDAADGRRARAVLVHPTEADAGRGRISVLSPVGRALLGRRAGHEVDVILPSGDTRTLVIVAVHEGSER